MEKEVNQTDDEDDVVETYLASRERQDGLSSVTTDVTITPGLISVTEPLILNDDGTTNTAPDGHPDDITVSDVKQALDQQSLPETIQCSEFANAEIPVLQTEHLRSLLRDDDIGRRLVAIPIQHDNKQFVRIVEQGFAISATLSDTGLGKRQQFQWTARNETQANKVADMLRAAASGDADSTLEHDDNLTLTINKTPDNYRGYLTLDNEKLSVKALLFWMLNIGFLFVIAGWIPAAIATVTGAAYVLSALDYVPTSTTIHLDDENNRSVVSTESIRNQLSESAFEHGGLDVKTPVSLTVNRTDDAITLTPTEPDDDRVWRIPTDETGTITSSAHVHFLDELGTESLDNGTTLTLMTAVKGTDADTGTGPRLLDTQEQYVLYPR